VLEGFRPGVMARLGLGPDDRNVWCSIPGFAHDDPRAGLAAWEGIVGAATGHYTANPREGRDGPAFSSVPLASSFASLVAVNSVLAALIARERMGRGQTVEVPLFGAMFEAIGSAGQKLPVAPVMPFTACSDIDAQGSDGRWIHLVMISPRHYEWFRDACLSDLGPPDLASRQRIVELIATSPAAEWDKRMNAAGIPCTIVRSTEQFLRGDAHAHRAVRRKCVAYGLKHFEREAHAVFERAAVVVGAPGLLAVALALAGPAGCSSSDGRLRTRNCGRVCTWLRV